MASLETPAYAQSSAEDTPATGMARERFKEGVEFYDSGSYEQARAAFLQAYALKKHPAVLLNLAWSCLKSDHFVEADRYFRRFLVEQTNISDKERADANDGLAQAQAKVGHIDIVAVPGAEIALDGEPAEGTSSPDGIPVLPGPHVLNAKTADGHSETQNVTVLAGDHVVVRFAKAPEVLLPTPAAPPAPTVAVAPVPAPGATPTEPATNATPHRSSGHGIFPVNMVPVYVGGLLTLAGASVAVGMFAAKAAAQESADQTTANIKAAGAKCPAAPSSPIATACSTIASDNDQVNADSTAGGIAIGVAILSLLSTVTYWVVSDKQDASEIARGPVLLPIVSQSSGGLSLRGTF